MPELPPYLGRLDDGVVVHVFVQPRAAKDALVGVHGRALKLKVTAPPVDGKANEATEKLLARWLGVPRSTVAVTSGHASRHKRIRIAGASAEAVAGALALVLSSRAHDGGQEALAEENHPEERRQKGVRHQGRGKEGRVETDGEEDPG